MSLQNGNLMPSATLTQVGAEGPKPLSTEELLKNEKEPTPKDHSVSAATMVLDKLDHEDLIHEMP